MPYYSARNIFRRAYSDVRRERRHLAAEQIDDGRTVQQRVELAVAWTRYHLRQAGWKGRWR